MSEVADILRQAADLIEPKGRWGRVYYARTKDGIPTGPRGPNAACWCAWGALRCVGRHDGDEAIGCAITFVQLALDDDLARWNDAPGRTQAEVVAALRAAADKAEQDEPK